MRLYLNLVPRALSISLMTLLLQAATVAGEDWPQWRGPDRDGKSVESGLLQAWPAQGPPKIWTTEGLGRGYGSVAIQGSQIFVQGTANGQSGVFSLEKDTGARVWSRPLGRVGGNDRGDGPRSTPTVEGDSLWALTENGDLARLDAATGAIRWKRNILRDFGGRNPNWLISESPLIEDSRVIVAPGGPDASVVALDKETGETIWTSTGLSDPAGYSSAIAVTIDGVRTILTFSARAAVGVRAEDGRPMWRYARVSNRTANITTPVFFDDQVFFTSAYGTGSVLLALDGDGKQVSADEIYFSREMQNHHGGVIYLDGYIYGFSNAILTCIEAASGRRVWRSRSVGKGSLTYADGTLYILSEDNVVGLVKATPEQYQELGRFSIEDQGYPSWAHPVVSGGHLYLRNQGQLHRYDVRAR